MPFKFGDRVRTTHAVRSDDGQTLAAGSEGLVVNDGKDRGQNVYYIGFSTPMSEGVKGVFASVLEDRITLAS